jgi:hypothetical protein
MIELLLIEAEGEGFIEWLGMQLWHFDIVNFNLLTK